MSIKSQKSLYEECSEIIERSYSVRSWSDESYSSCDDEDECLARDLMTKMTPAVLSKLRRCFRTSRDSKRVNDIDRKVEKVMRAAAAEEGIEFAAPVVELDPLWLDEAGFVGALDNIFGHHRYTTHATKLFQLLDPLRTGRVRWRQLLDRLVVAGARTTRTRADVWTQVKEGRVLRVDSCKRETLVKLLPIERPDSFCYVAVSRGGRVGVYSGQMQLMYSYEVFYHRTGIQRRVRNCWITDAVYLSDVQSIILSASDRSLTVYDASTLTHTPIFCITGLQNIPTCMAYSPSTSELAIGSERGEVTRVRFLQPRVSLFYAKAADHINCYFWMELSSPPHTSYISTTTHRRVHSRSIRRLTYDADGEILLSCSHDNNVSVRLRYLSGKLDDYLFKVQRGVTCFHVIHSLHTLAAGSTDGCIRLWELTQSSPYATLTSPPSPLPAAVLDVAVVTGMQVVVGFCSNCFVHIWDLYEECLLQTIRVKFPFLGVLGKKIEFGPYCIHPGLLRHHPSSPESPESLLGQETVSRRGSSVYQGSTGGLMLNEESQQTKQDLEEQQANNRFNRPEILVTCCDYVCIIQLNKPSGTILPPPGDTLRARRPSYWDLPDDVLKTPPPAPAPTPRPSLPADPPSSFLIPASMLLSPSTAELPQQDLDTLLENAGLQGILEKDFVMMQGFKHDLNRKLADLKANMNSINTAVSMGAPYLALSCPEPASTEPGDLMMDRYRAVTGLFPESSVAATPTTSNPSTPRKKASLLL